MGQICTKIKRNPYAVRDDPGEIEADQDMFKPNERIFGGRTRELNVKSKSSIGKLWNRKNTMLKDNTLYVEAADAEIDPHAEKLQEDRMMIINALNSHFIFTSLSDDDKEVVANAMQLYTFEAGKIVFEQDRPSKSYYVVRSGLLEVIVHGRRVNKIHSGEGFGELALLHDNPRSATVKCLEFITLWGIERQTFRKVIEEMNTQIYEQNREFLDKVTLLQPLSSHQKDSLAASLVTLKFPAGQKIISEGETGQNLFIVKEGTVSILKNNSELGKLHPGNYFGELALLNNTLRTATCVAQGGMVKCVALSRETLQKILGNQLQEIIEKNTALEAINKSESLSLLNRDQKDHIIRDIQQKTYKGGDIVIPVGTPCQSKLFIVLSGKLQLARTSQTYAEKATCIGDNFVSKNNTMEIKYEDDIIAGVDMKLGEMTKYQFEVSIGGKYEEVVKENAATNILRKVYLFSSLDSKTMKTLFGIINIQKYQHDQIILKENDPGEAIYIVKRGRVIITKNGNELRTVTKFDYFGERSLLFENRVTATCIAFGNVTLWIIYKSDFLNILTENMRQQLMKRIKYQDEKVSLQNLIVIKLLGKGMFGKVYLVRPVDSYNLYALKAIPRRKIEKFYIQEHILREKRMLLHVDHPFIAKLIRTFKDEKRLYFLLEYVHGLTLNFIMTHVGLLSNSDSQFYMGSLILVLEYLHERDIIYRDLKPENVMVDVNGYIKLIDFGTATDIKGRTYTLVGTPHYMAPEVIVGKGYNKNADLWSLGICLYEFLCGRVPFGEEEEDPYKIYEEILDMNLIFPIDIDPPADTAKSLIQQLLSKFPEMRTGGSIESIKKHEWFEGFDWEGLIKQTLVAPYTPDVGDMHEELEDEPNEPSSPWDQMLDRISEESDTELPEVLDTDIEEYKSSIPQYWDERF
jgi:cGMP-dependent protein kinase